MSDSLIHGYEKERTTPTRATRTSDGTATRCEAHHVPLVSRAIDQHTEVRAEAGAPRTGPTHGAAEDERSTGPSTGRCEAARAPPRVRPGLHVDQHHAPRPANACSIDAQCVVGKSSAAERLAPAGDPALGAGTTHASAGMHLKTWAILGLAILPLECMTHGKVPVGA